LKQLSQKNCTSLSKRRVLRTLVPDRCWIEFFGNIALNDFYAVLGISNGSRLAIFANRKPALPIVNSALIDEHFVTALVTYPKTNQPCVPNNFIWFHGFHN
jgi:hypothetical protein